MIYFRGMETIIFLLAVVGAAHVATESKIGTPIRVGAFFIGEKVGYLFSCAPCFGFWFAAAWIAVGGGPTGSDAAVINLGESGFRFVQYTSYALSAVACNRILFGFGTEDKEGEEKEDA